MSGSPIKSSPLSLIGNFVRRHQVLVLSALVSLLLGLIYLSVASARLTNANFGSDAGDFLSALLTQGIPHPTGYPTFLVLGRLFQYIPLSTPVFRLTLFSLSSAALAAGLLTGWMAFVLPVNTPLRLVAAAVSGIAWGVAPLVFSQAVIVEVHGLQCLVIVLVLWWLTLNLQADPGRYTGWILGLAFLVGLGCGNHTTIALLAPAAIIILAWVSWRTRRWKLLVGQLALLLVGMLVYLYLPLQARSYPPVNWGNPQTLSGFIWEVTASPYRLLVFRTEPTVLMERITSIAALLLDQFGAVALVAGVIGLFHSSILSRGVRWLLVWTFVIYFAFAIGYNTQDLVSYLLPAVMVFAIWVGLAIPALAAISWKRFPLGILLVVVLAISLGMRIPGTRTRVDPRSQDQPAVYAEQILQDAPQNAIIRTTTDQDTFPLWYYHFGLGERPDLRILVMPLTQFVWYQETLVHTYPDLSYPPLYEEDTPDTDWGKQVLAMNPGRPVCSTNLSSETETGIAYQCTSP